MVGRSARVSTKHSAGKPPLPSIDTLILCCSDRSPSYAPLAPRSPTDLFYVYGIPASLFFSTMPAGSLLVWPHIPCTARVIRILFEVCSLRC